MVGIFPLAPHHDSLQYIHHVHLMQRGQNRGVTEKEKEAQKSYKPYYKRREDNNQSKPPPHSPASMILTKVGMDNFCTFHQQPHSKKNCPQ